MCWNAANDLDDTSYAVPPLAVDSASGRAEYFILLFCKKDRSRTMLPQANPAVVGVHIRFVYPARNSCE